MLIILVLLSLFISITVILLSLGVAANNSSKLLDEKILNDIKY